MTASSESETKNDAIKKAVLLHCVDEEILGILNKLDVADDTSYVQPMKALEDYFIPKQNVTVDRHNL